MAEKKSGIHLAREAAVKRGTATGEGQDPQIPYNPQGGHPVGPGMPAGTYGSKVLPPEEARTPINPPKPFALK